MTQVHISHCYMYMVVMFVITTNALYLIAWSKEVFCFVLFFLEGGGGKALHFPFVPQLQIHLVRRAGYLHLKISNNVQIN